MENSSEIKKANLMKFVNEFKKNKLEDHFFSLFRRWEDEKEYEDFEDYNKALKAAYAKYGIIVNSATKRPFGFKAFLSSDPSFTVWARIEKKGTYCQFCYILVQ